MWFRKKALPVPCLECTGCGCSMWTARKEVEVERASGSLFDAGGTMTYYIGSDYPEPSVESYCGRCAPPYDMKRVAGGEVSYYRQEPSKNIEVTEKGKKLGGE